MERGGRTLAMSWPLPLVIATMAFTSVPAVADEQAVKWEGLTRSELIVLAKVVKVVDGEPLRFARLEVESAWKGFVPDELWIVASQTWQCDESWAVEGERAVFFLRRVSDEQQSDSVDAIVPNAWKKFGHGGPVYKISGEGKGRLILRQSEGVTYVEAVAGVVAPEFLKRIAKPSGHWWATVSDLKRAVTGN